jgi:predicted component of type VI protein secretion system
MQLYIWNIDISNKSCQYRRTHDWMDDTPRRLKVHQQMYRRSDCNEIIIYTTFEIFNTQKHKSSIFNTRKHKSSIFNTRKHNSSIFNTRKHNSSIFNTQKHKSSIFNTQKHKNSKLLVCVRANVHHCLRAT